MVQVLNNLQSSGQSRDLQIEIISKAQYPDIYAPEYQGELPNLTDEEKTALSWLYGHTSDDELLGAHNTPAPVVDEKPEEIETGTDGSTEGINAGSGANDNDVELDTE